MDLTQTEDQTNLTELERAFYYYWKALSAESARDLGIAFPDLIEDPVAQVKVQGGDPSRRKSWVLDWAFPALKIGIELDGGNGGGFGRPVVCHNCGTRVRARLKNGEPGRELRIGDPSHASGPHQERDALKNNDLLTVGWIVLRFTSKMVYDAPADVVQTVLKTIRVRSKNPAPDRSI